MNPPVAITLDAATAVARACGIAARVTAIRPLEGGMINTVQAWTLDAAPGELVAKLTATPADRSLRDEATRLTWCRDHTQFPVPQVYGSAGADGFTGTALLLEMLPGRHLGAARVSPAGLKHVQRQMAEHLAALHTHRGPAYGAVTEEPVARWTDWLAPRMDEMLHDAAPLLSAETRRTARQVIDHLADWLPETDDPRAVHGDIWATNVMVDDADPDAPRITGFIDGGGLFADVEFELAYLLVFNSVGDAFFDRYQDFHDLRAGFDRRCRVYWLNTLLIHVALFGTEYVPRTERLAAELRTLA